MRLILTGMMVLMGAASIAHGAVRFVDASLATGANDGSSWTDAFQGRLGLQAAIAASQAGDQIWLADGVYAPAAVGADRGIYFAPKDGTAIYGGFAGGEALLTDRDPAAHPAILTGDLNSNDPTVSDNSWHVLIFENVVSGCTLDGVTVERGRAFSVPGTVPNAEQGSCVLVRSGSPTIRRCRMRLGFARRGGGAAVVAGSAVFDTCTFSSNTTQGTGGGAEVIGGSAQFLNCTFESNIGGNGGGLATSGGTTTVVEDCVFNANMGNISIGDGPGAFFGGGNVTLLGSTFSNNFCGSGGGAFYVRGAAVTADRCILRNNEAVADGGGAIFIDSGSLTMTNSSIVGNSKKSFAVITTLPFGTPSPIATFINCTIAGNGDSNNPVFGGFFVFNSSGAAFTAFRNCIFWANIRPGGAVAPLFSGSNPANTHAILSNCCVQQGVPAVLDGGGNITSDPLLALLAGLDGVTGTADDNLNLSAGSPCIDHGDNGMVPSSALLDLAGSGRFHDDPAAVDTGIGTAPLVDLGAIEFVPPCPSDLNHDGAVGTSDLIVLLGAFGKNVAPGSGGDINGDGFVGTADLTALLGTFGQNCP